MTMQSSLNMNSIWLQFQETVSHLRQHSMIVVENFNTFSPVSQSVIQTIEQSIGHSLPETLREFYNITNGLDLVWRFKDLPHSRTKTRTKNGKIRILPLEQVFEDSIIEQRKNRFMLDDCNDGLSLSITLNSKNNNIWKFNFQNQEYSEISFGQYFQFLTASKGFLPARNTFFTFPELSNNAAWNLDKLAIHHYFKWSDQAGANTQNLKTQFMQQRAKNKVAITQDTLIERIEAHHHFLSTGGAGGRWKTFHVSGLVFGVYTGAKSEKGQQANFEQQNLSSTTLDTIGSTLPFTTFIGMYAKYQDFSESDLSYSIFTDAMLEKAIFADSNLEYSDFSRANLRHVSFMNANLKGVDFENCDLTGADFRGANWQGAKFPGAILNDIQF